MRCLVSASLECSLDYVNTIEINLTVGQYFSYPSSSFASTFISDFIVSLSQLNCLPLCLLVVGHLFLFVSSLSELLTYPVVF